VLGDVAGKKLLHLQCHSAEPQRIEAIGSYACDNPTAPGISYEWNHSLGDSINALHSAGVAVEFLHDFLYAARAKFPFILQEDDGWWRLPPHQHGTIPFLIEMIDLPKPGGEQQGRSVTTDGHVKQRIAGHRCVCPRDLLAVFDIPMHQQQFAGHSRGLASNPAQHNRFPIRQEFCLKEITRKPVNDLKRVCIPDNGSMVGGG
jgi:hypothetical protein